MTGPNSPNALGRSSVENAERMMPKPWGIISAAASPWVRRNTISTRVSGAIPLSSELTVKSAMPIMNSRRRPNRSPRRPPTTRPTASASA